jgi:hypothetical protein
MVSYFSPADSRFGSNQASKASKGSCVIANYSLIKYIRHSFGDPEQIRIRSAVENSEKLSQTTLNSKSVGPLAGIFAENEAG